MPEDKPEPDKADNPRIERLLELLEDISRHLRHESSGQWPDVELTMPQLRTMVLLDSGPYRMSDIADNIGSSYSATTAMIDRLVDKGLVKRVHSTTDRRVVTCELTPLGRATLDELWGMQRLGMSAVAQVLTDDELDAVIRAMEIMRDAAERLDPRTANTS